jgi:hypothetical protein
VVIFVIVSFIIDLLNLHFHITKQRKMSLMQTNQLRKNEFSSWPDLSSNFTKVIMGLIVDNLRHIYFFDLL